MTVFQLWEPCAQPPLSRSNTTQCAACSKYPATQIPPQYKGVLELDESNPGVYLPHIWFNDFWLLKDYLVCVWDNLTGKASQSMGGHANIHEG